MDSGPALYTRQKLYNVIKVSPKRLDPGDVPQSFLSDLKKKKLLQDKSISVLVIPLDIKKYKTLSLRKYSPSTILYLFNNHLFIIGETLKYVMRYPLLVKGLIDSLFELSGREVEELNWSQGKLFQLLKERRRELGNFDALLDNFVLANMGIEQYLKFRELDNLEDRLAIVAVLENYFGVIIEERYELSRKIKKPIKLTPDKNFHKEYERIMGKESGQDFGFGDITKALAERMQEDKKYAEYGIKRTVHTDSENREITSVDGPVMEGTTAGVSTSGSGLKSNLD